MKHMIWISLILALIMSQITLAFYKTSNNLKDKGNTKKKGRGVLNPVLEQSEENSN